MKIAVVGATGAVGREIIEDLANSSLANIELVALASPRSEGQTLNFRDKRITVRAWSLEALGACKYVLMSAGGAFSREHAHAMVERGLTVIDNSSAWRADENIPLIVPEVNGEVLRAQMKAGKRVSIVANPNCAMIQLAVSLQPLHAKFGLSSVQVATYQSVSGTGQKGIKELSDQVQARLRFEEVNCQVYEQPIAFNLLPAIGPLNEEGYCEEETKIVYEMRRVLGLPNLPILATTVRVPVFNCHSASVFVQLKQPVSREEVLGVWRQAPGLRYVDGTRVKDLPTPFHMTGEPDVAVARLRLPPGEKRSPCLQYWNVADNLKKGAATNAVQILTMLLSESL